MFRKFKRPEITKRNILFPEFGIVDILEIKEVFKKLRTERSPFQSYCFSKNKGIRKL